MEHAALIATDTSGRITRWNARAESLYGWPADEVLGRSITELTVAPADHDAASAIMRVLASGRSWEGRFTVARKDGSRFEALVLDYPVFVDGTLASIVRLSVAASESDVLDASSPVDEESDGSYLSFVGEGSVLRISGELDLASAPTLARAVTEAIDSADGDVVLDLRELSFIDATGLGTLLDARNTLDVEGRTLVLRAPSKAVRRMLSLTDLSDRFTMQQEG